MILKTYEFLKKTKLTDSIYLLYGDNEGYQNEIQSKILGFKNKAKILKYDEKEFFENYNTILSELYNKSFFESEKIILINRVTDKISQFIYEILEKELESTTIILKAGILEKKSKLRSIFEKNKSLICIPFYADDQRTLVTLASNFFKESNISVSFELINTLVERCNGNRGYLENELKKIKLYSEGKKVIVLKDIFILTNLTENINVSELVDNCLSKNQKKIIKIINENNYNNEDCILITRTFLSKLKRLKNLRANFDKNNDLEGTISNHKPPIFWKDKHMVSEQIRKMGLKEINNLIIKMSNLELLIKENSNNSINILYDFILGNCREPNN
tara:strand:- start:113 stop:1108 length:996 start_codon:yes stop_codon:yes gene_type:complete